MGKKTVLRIIGKCKQMRTVLMYDEDRKLTQRPIQRGIEYVIPAEDMNFHIQRQQANKNLIVMSMEEEIKEPTPVVKTKKVEATPKEDLVVEAVEAKEETPEEETPNMFGSRSKGKSRKKD